MAALRAPALLIALSLAGAVCLCCAQTQPWPIQGQGEAPEGTTQVTMDILFDSIESIKSDSNTFGAVVWLHMVWRDDRAYNAILAATAAFATTGKCDRACDMANIPTGGCCSDVWLPHIDLPNLKYISQDSVTKSRIWVEPVADGSTSTGFLHWSLRFMGEFHSPYDFRAWPFEHQHLLMELQMPPSLADRVGLVLRDVTTLKDTAHTKGEVVPGWWIARITKRAFDTSACYNQSNVVTSLFNVNGSTVTLKPLSPSSWAQLSTPNDVQRTTLPPDQCSNIQKKVGLSRYYEAQAQYNPEVLVVDIMVKRAKSYYVLSNIVPQLLLAYMVFVTYAMERTDLESRMMVVVTLVLATSALQFTWNFPPANFLNGVQQITLTSYCLYFLVAIESMFSSHICRRHEHRRQRAQIQAALAGPGPLMAMKPHVPGAPYGAAAPSPIGSGPALGSQNWGGMQGMQPLPEECEVQPSPDGHHDQYGSFARQAGGGGALPTRSQNIGRLPTSAQPVSESSAASTSLYSGGPVAEAVLERPSTANMLPGSIDKSDDGQAFVQPAVSAAKPGPAPLDLAWATANPPPKPVRRQSTLARYTRAVSTRLSGAAKSTREFGQRINKDEAYALHFARRLDMIFCWVLLASYTVVMIVLLWVNAQVGDHKLMLQGDRPANM